METALGRAGAYLSIKFRTCLKAEVYHVWPCWETSISGETQQEAARAHDISETPTMSIGNIGIQARKYSFCQPDTTGCFW